MKFDYWNHPLVVSAFRVRFRGRAPGAAAMIYFLALLSLGGILQYNLANEPQVSWVLIYFVVLISIECAVAALFAASATFQSMHNEVVNRTLDYQRTAAIGPHEILLGKLLGEPAQGYMLALAGLPLLVWCLAMGVTTPGVFALLLINLVTTTFMFGAFGLAHPLDTSVERSKASGRSVRAVGILVGLVIGLQMLVATNTLVQSPLGQAALGLLTPALAIYGVAIGDPMSFCLNLFGVEIPYLFVTPIAQVAVALMVIHSIARRLVSPLNTALSKPTAYCVLLVIDVLTAGLLGSSIIVNADRVVAGFCLIHLLSSLFLTMAITPGRETLKTWIWRFRGRLPYWKDMLWGPRSGNLGALVVFSVIGAAITPLVALAVDGRSMTPISQSDLMQSTIRMLVATTVVLLALGSLFQWLLSIGQAGGVMFIGMVAMFSVVPHLAGAYLDSELLVAASPSGQFASWLFQVPPTLRVEPLLVVYGAMFVITQRLNARRISLGIAAVKRKIEIMLAEPEKVSAPPSSEGTA
ncbi:MAG TPA: hypothetical protein VGJ26_01210 [Pirellulales bacterium]|jgi:hypothetical protein